MYSKHKHLNIAYCLYRFELQMDVESSDPHGQRFIISCSLPVSEQL